jgi:hypothetical protein
MQQRHCTANGGVDISVEGAGEKNSQKKAERVAQLFMLSGTLNQQQLPQLLPPHQP